MSPIHYALTPQGLKLLRDMRDLQRRFFLGDREVIGRCKALEREVDRLLAAYPQDGANLFDSSGDPHER